MTLNDLERRNDRYLAFFAEFGSFGADYVKVVEDRPTQSAKKCSPNNLVFSDLSFMAIFAEVTVNERILIGTCAICIHFSIMTHPKVSLCSRFYRDRPTSTVWL